jgi:hypothetical protein
MFKRKATRLASFRCLSVRPVESIQTAVSSSLGADCNWTRFLSLFSFQVFNVSSSGGLDFQSTSISTWNSLNSSI